VGNWRAGEGVADGVDKHGSPAILKVETGAPMARQPKEGSLSADEKRVVKALLLRGWRNQDIQALVNIGRPATINGARITEVKQSTLRPASDEMTDFFLLRKRSYDPRTGLNLYDDERLIRSREAMILAVQIFNSPMLKFKTEVFAILANVAWTYLLHEYYRRRGMSILNESGRALLLSQMVKRDDCPLSKGIKNNLEDMKVIRDDVEHKLLGRGDARWFTLFQACCLNYDKTISEWFGERVSLQGDLAFALQFARLSMDQITTIQKYEVPQEIEALDAMLDGRLTEEERTDLEYRFRVVYTLDSASKGRSHIEFLHPSSDEAEQVRNILVKYKLSDELYPHKPATVAKLVRRKSGKRFTSHNHVQAWRKFAVRPRNRTSNPGNTKKDYCVYHAAHRDYTYSEAWVDFLVDQISTEEGYRAILSQRV